MIVNCSIANTFFADEPCLLGGTQTFMGVLLTIIVLCIFNNDANFLYSLIRNVAADIADNLKKWVAKTNDEIERFEKGLMNQEEEAEDKDKKEKNGRSRFFPYWNGKNLGDIRKERKWREKIKKIIKNNEREEKEITKSIENEKSLLEWVRIAKKYPDYHQRLLKYIRKRNELKYSILRDLQEPINEFEIISDHLEMKKEQNFVFIYFLILLFFVMTIDACCINLTVGCYFLTMECIMSSYFSYCLWYRYYNDKKKNEPVYERRKREKIYKDLILFTFLLFCFWFAVLCIDLQGYIIWSIILLVSLIIVLPFSQPVFIHFRYTNKYNNQFIIKHAFYILFFCLLSSFVLLLFNSIEIPKELTLWHTITTNLHNNLQYLQDHFFVIRIMFVIICVGNIFFIPLVVGYCYNRKKAKEANQMMNDNYEQIKKNLEDMIKNDYSKIITAIKEEESKNTGLFL